jgi:hypothetical protein
MENGIDFSFGSGLTAGEVKNGGKAFVCRYLSGGSSKDINAAELAAWKAAGIGVVFVWETDGIMSSQAEGASHATVADAQLKQIGASGAVVFFAADAAAMPDLHGYMAGVVSVLGKARTGIYGGISSVSAAFNDGLVTFGWQTLAWSNGQWDNRALLRQVQNGVNFGPAQVDLDQAAFWNSSKVLTMSDDFGQWPRPGTSGPPPGNAPYRQVVPAGSVATLEDIAIDRGWSLDKLVAYSMANMDPANMSVMQAYMALFNACVASGHVQKPVAPSGMVYETVNP